MKDVTRQKIVWGWLRVFLGITQMSLAAATLGALLTVGTRPVTWALAGGTVTALVISRLLYRGR